MKILLINPPFQRLKGIDSSCFPMGLGYLGASLSNAGFNVKIYDPESSTGDENLSPPNNTILLEREGRYTDATRDNGHYVWKEVSEVIKRFKPDMVCLSVRTSVYASAVKVSELCKKYNKKCIVVWGGVHPSLLAKETMENENDIDYVIFGEGEITIVELAKVLENGKGGLEKVDGIGFRNKGTVVVNSPRQLEKNIDNFPYPSIELLWNSKGNDEKIDVHPIMGSRGCPYNCGYCSSPALWGHNVRSRSVQNVLDEIKMHKNKFGITEFEFFDDVFTLNRDWVKELCESMIKEEILISWHCNTRANCLDEELLGIMKKSGCKAIHIGVETGSEVMAQYLNRRLAFNDIWKASDLLCSSGIDWYAFFMVGFPNETKRSIEKTIKTMRKLPASKITLSVFTPYPGTILYDKVKEMGMLPKPVKWGAFSFNIFENCFVKDIDKEVFFGIVKDMAKEADELNSWLSTKLTRIFAKRKYYLKHPLEFINDFTDIFFLELKNKVRAKSFNLRD